MLLQLNPPIPVVTPRGKGLCHFVIDYGPEAQIFMTVFLDESREIWTYASRECRARENITMGRCDKDSLKEASDNLLKAIDEYEFDKPAKPKPRPVDLENDFPPQNPFKAMEDGVDNPQTAEDWMRQPEWKTYWITKRVAPTWSSQPHSSIEFSVIQPNDAGAITLGSGSTLAAACRQAVLWKRNQPDNFDVARTNEETYQKLPGEDKSAAVPLANYAEDVANMPAEVRPEVPATVAEDSNPW